MLSVLDEIKILRELTGVNAEFRHVLVGDAVIKQTGGQTALATIVVPTGKALILTSIRTDAEYYNLDPSVMPNAAQLALRYNGVFQTIANNNTAKIFNDCSCLFVIPSGKLELVSTWTAKQQEFIVFSSQLSGFLTTKTIGERLQSFETVLAAKPPIQNGGDVQNPITGYYFCGGDAVLER